MKKVVKVVVIVISATTIIFLGLLVGYVSDSEEWLKTVLKDETGISLPHDYTVLNNTGYLQKDSIHYDFKFDDAGLQKIISDIKKTPFFNDTLTVKQSEDLTWDRDDPKQPWKFKGIWLESDSAFVFFTPIGVHTESGHIFEARLIKRNGILTAGMML